MKNLGKAPMFGNSAARKTTALRSKLALLTLVLIALFVPASANAAFGVSGFTFKPSMKQAAAHPTVTFSFSRTGTNSDDLQNVAIDYPPGMVFSQDAVSTKCPEASFNLDGCSSDTYVGKIQTSLIRENTGAFYPVSGSVYVVEPSGSDQIVLGMVLRPTFASKIYLKQSIRVRNDSPSASYTTTHSGMQTLAWGFPTTVQTLSGTEAIAVRNVRVDLYHRSKFNKSGPFFVYSSPTCFNQFASMTATSSASVAVSQTVQWYAANCSTVPFSPTVANTLTDSTARHFTGASLSVSVPRSPLTIEQSSVKTVAQTFALGSTINYAAFSALGAGCSEADLADDGVCPPQYQVGTATSAIPAFTPDHSGAIYLMSPVSSTLKFATVLNGPRGMRSIVRSTAGESGSGGTARAYHNIDDTPNIPFSNLTLNFTAPLMKNPTACPSAGDGSATVASFSGQSAVRATGTAISCAPPADPDTISVSGPSGVVGNPTQTFSFTSDIDHPDATFECSADGDASLGPWTACVSGGTQTVAATEGVHHVFVRAVDGTSDSSPLDYSFTLDVTDPTVSITQPAGLHSAAPITVDFTATDNHPGTSVCALDSVTVACAAPVSASHGTHSFSVTHTDQVGRVGSASSSFEVDSQGPAVSFTSPVSSPAYSTTALIPIAFSSTDPHPGATPATCTLSSVSAPTPQSVSCSADLDPTALGNDTFSLSVCVLDTFGNSGCGAQAFTVNIVTVTPETQITVGPESGLSITDPTPEWEFTSDDPTATFQCNRDGAGWTACTSPYSVSDTRTYDGGGKTTGGTNGYDVGGTLYDPTPDIDGNPDASGDEYDVPSGQIEVAEAGTHSLMVRARSAASVLDPTPDVASFAVGTFDPAFEVTMVDPSDPTDTQGNDAGAHPDISLNASLTSGDVAQVIGFAPKYAWGANNAVTTCSTTEALDGVCNSASKIGEFSITGKANRLPHDSIIGLHDLTLSGEIFLTERWAPGEAAGAVARVNIIDTDGRNYGQVNQRVHLVVAYANDYDQSLACAEAGGEASFGPWTPNCRVDNPFGIKAIIDDVPRISPNAVDGAKLELHARSVTGTVWGNAAHYENPLLYNSYDCAATPGVNVWRGIITTYAHTGAATLPNGLPRESDSATPTQPYDVDNCETVPFATLLEKVELYDVADPSRVTSDPGSAPGKGRPLAAHAEISVAPGSGTLKYATLNLPASIRQRTAGIVKMCASTGDPDALNGDTDGDSVPDYPMGRTTIDPAPNCDEYYTKIGTFTASSPLLSTEQSGVLYLEDTQGPLPSIYGFVNDVDLGLNVRIRAASGLNSPANGASGLTFIKTQLNANADNSQTEVPSLPISKITLDLTGSDAQGAIIEVAPNCATEDAGSGNAVSWTGATNDIITDRMYFGNPTDGTCESTTWMSNGPRPGDTTSDNTPTWDATRTMAAWTSTNTGARRRMWYECGTDRAVWVVCGSTTLTSGALGVPNVVAPGGPYTLTRTGLPTSPGVMTEGNHRFAVRFKFVQCIPSSGTAPCTPAAAAVATGTVLTLPGGQSQEEVVYKVDTTVPSNTSIESGPADGAIFNGPNPPVYVFRTDELTANFQCSFDDAFPPIWQTCPSGQPIRSVPFADGPHSFDVRAWDGVNGDPTPVHRTFTIVP